MTTTKNTPTSSSTPANNSLVTGSSINLISSPVRNVTLTGTGNLTVIANGLGDTIHANSGNDLIWGGSGNDTVYVGSGSDRIFGGGGTDTVVFSGKEANYTVSAMGENWTVADTTHHDGTAYLSNVEVLKFADRTANLMFVASSNTTVTGGAGDNYIETLRGHVKVNGGAGNDTVFVGAGYDTIDGGSGGTDTVVFSGKRANYTVTQTASGWTVTDTTGHDGINVLSHITRLQFTDQTVNLTSPPPVLTPPPPPAPTPAPIVALAPTLTVAPASGNENSPIALNVSSALVPNGGSESLSVTISGVPTGATLSAGQSDGKGNWTLTASQLTGLTYKPATNTAGDVTLKVSATATEASNHSTATSTASLGVHVAPIALAPTLTVAPVTGDENQPVALNITSSLVPNGGSESLTIKISGVPTGASLSAGTSDGHGNWTLTAAQLAGLTLTPATNTAGDLPLQVIATATETSNNTTAATTAALPVHVNAEALAPTLSVAPASGNENTAIALNIASAVVPNGGSESLSLTISGVPTGATLSAGTSDGHGNWTLTAAQLAGLMFTPASNMTGDLSLQVKATATEASNHTFASTSVSLPVHVAVVTPVDPPPAPPPVPPTTPPTITPPANAVSGNVTGTPGNDTFYIGTANANINGNGGTDTVVFTGNEANYVVTATAWTGNWTITDSTHHDGTVNVSNVAKLQFADHTANLIEVSPSFSVINGLPGDNYILTDRGYDTISGGSGNNTIFVGDNDTITGGGGHNTVVFSGNMANYQITQNGSSWIVTDHVGQDGINSLTNVETLRFADQTFTLPATSTGGGTTPPSVTPPTVDPPPVTTPPVTTPPVTVTPPPTITPPPPPAGGLIAPPSVLQPSHAGDIVGVNIQNNSGQAEGARVYTFGEVFKDGDLPAGSHLVAMLNGQQIPLQMDVKTTYADGSVDSAVLTMQLPSIAANSSLDIMLAKGTPVSSGPALNIASLTNGSYDLSVNVNMHNANGTTTAYTVNAASVLQQALANGTAQTWMSGPLATEVRVTSNITSTLHATFDIRTMADGSTHTDVSFGYDGAYTVGNNNITYDVAINSGGHTVFSDNNLTQNQHSNWHQEIWSNGAPTLQAVYDVPYLERTGAIPTYDTSIPVSDATIASEYAAMQAANNGPMGTGTLTTYMPQTGQTDSDTVGVMSNWETMYLLSQDPRAQAVMMANANAGGSIPWHFMDEATGAPVTIDAHPGIRISQNGPGSGTDALPQTWDPTTTLWTPDVAHQPDLFYLAYLTTGSHYYLDELQYQAAFDLAYYNEQFRGGSQGLINTQGEEQTRAVAWDMRTLADAAYASPNGDPLKAYFTNKLDNNLAYQDQTFVTNNALGNEGALKGWYTGDWTTGNTVETWQQSFMSMAYTQLVQQGFTQALPMLNWMENFQSGLFLNGANGYNPLFGAPYYLQMLNPATGQLYTTWAQVFAANFGTETVPNGITESGNPASAGAYWGAARGGLAGLITQTGSPDAIEAYGYVVQQTQNSGLVQDLSNMSKYGMVPILSNGQALLDSNIQVDYSSSNVTLTAGSQNALLYAGSGNDTLIGGSGVDLMFGGPGTDKIVAGSGNAYIYAGSGATTIVDGTGSNYMKAGTGADTFVFDTANSGHDQIAGFKVGTDHLQIGPNLNGNGLTTAAAILAGATSDAQGNTVLHLSGHDDIVLLGVTAGHLTASSIVIGWQDRCAGREIRGRRPSAPFRFLRPPLLP